MRSRIEEGGNMKRILLTIILGLVLLSTAACTSGQEEEIASPEEIMEELESLVASFEQELLEANEKIRQFATDVCESFEALGEQISQFLRSLTAEPETV